MAVKMRLKRMGKRKILSIELLLADARSPEMEETLMKSVSTTQIRSRQSLRSTRKLQKHGLEKVRSQQTQLQDY